MGRRAEGRGDVTEPPPAERSRGGYARKPFAIRALRAFRWVVPGDYLQTFLYRILVRRPRRLMRVARSFYRFDHVYDVIEEARRKYKGRFTILEFGTSAGYAFTKILYATRYLGMADRITIHGFDTFEGMPATEDRADQSAVRGEGWAEGEFAGSERDLEGHCRASGYDNFRLHAGLFADTLTPALLRQLEAAPPILVWIDCDYYSSTKSVLERLVPVLPSGCVLYFDDVDFNHRSTLTGEMKAIRELNEGCYGDQIELVEDRNLGGDSQRVYRFVRLGEGPRLQRRFSRHRADWVRRPSGGSPLP
ncbi:MAG: class I SAM-dependent methyltransferase [Gemmatimonadetes bacterium]|nr:class I SAM-dependent methyltransferase [Gemmatimonadota bacterium]NNK63691.1 hypothetical protein [Gemmatimonadota bacterium]